MKKQLIYFVILLVLFFSVANIHVTNVFNIEEFPISQSMTFDAYLRTDYKERINMEKPTIIAIGDSAIRQFDDFVFSKESGFKSLFFPAPGSGSAYWYLFIRNQILQSTHKPRFVLIFFRETTLTIPEYRVMGDYFVRLEEIAGPNDGDVYKLAVNSRKSWWMLLCERYLPIFAYRSEIYFNTVQWFRNVLPLKVYGVGEGELGSVYDNVFDDVQVNDLLWEEYLLNIDSALRHPLALDFSEKIEESFLPYIMRDLKLTGITPIFVRVKYRSHAMGEKDSLELLTYLTELESYIEENGGLYIDMVDIEELTSNMYRDNFHIDVNYSDVATQIVARVISEQIYKQ